MKTLQILIALLILTILYFTAIQARRNASSAEFDAIRAKTFELVDDNGRVRASLVTEQDGGVVFRLKDADGTIRVKLGASKKGSGLVLLNGTTEPGIHMLANTDSTSITLTDVKGNQKQIKP